LPLTTGITGTLAIGNGGTGSTSTTYCSLTTNVTGTLPIANGGTGQTTALAAYNALSPMTTLGDMEYEGAGSSALRLPIGSTSQVLTVVGGVPAWATPAGGGVTTISFGSTGLTPSTATSGAVTVAGTLGVANGGTGLTATPTNGQIPIGNGTNFTLATLTQGTGITIANTSGAITISSAGGGTGFPPRNSGYSATSAVFTPQADSKYIIVYVAGGGGGGGGGLAGNGGNNGGAGGASSFGTMVTANGGNGGGGTSSCAMGNSGTNGNTSVNAGVTTIPVSNQGTDTTRGTIQYVASINSNAGSGNGQQSCQELFNGVGGTGGNPGAVFGRIARATYGNTGIQVVAGNAGNAGTGGQSANPGSAGCVFVTEFFG
jgi:hypothetical protein